VDNEERLNKITETIYCRNFKRRYFRELLIIFLILCVLGVLCGGE